ncbi:hypothetical protein RUM43_011895 [Polyplax serrata]|uniref:Uncharacterized protein n=1 Tax=Polyplax serrata TaxID=468196 RepID=A0AAN8PJ30_POLSC
MDKQKEMKENVLFMYSGGRLTYRYHSQNENTGAVVYLGGLSCGYRERISGGENKAPPIINVPFNLSI